MGNGQIRKTTVSQLTCKQLEGLVAKRHLCLTQLRDLGRKQSELIAGGEMGALLRLISAKNQLIVALQAIERELAPYHAQDPEQRKWSSDADRTRCAAQAAECRQLLEEVMQMERDNEARMIRRRDQVATRLQTAQQANNARGAYQAQQRSHPLDPHTPRTPISSGEFSTPGGQRLDIQSDA